MPPRAIAGGRGRARGVAPGRIPARAPTPEPEQRGEREAGAPIPGGLAADLAVPVRGPAAGGPCPRAFENLAPHIYGAYATSDHHCRSCNHPVHTHAPAPPPAPAAAPAVVAGCEPAPPADPEVVLGPSLNPPSDPGLVFLRVLDAWSMGRWCTEDLASVRAALQNYQVAMFNGSTTFVRSVFRVTGGPDVGRAFALREGLDGGVDARRNRGRDIMAVVDLAVRVAIPLARALARHRQNVQRCPVPVMKSREGQSVEVAFVEELSRATVVLQPFQLVPAEDTWAGPEAQGWWGLWLATAPPELLRQSFERLVSAAAEKYRASRAHLFCDQATWELKFKEAGSEKRRRGPSADPRDFPGAKMRRRGRSGRGMAAASATGTKEPSNGTPGRDQTPSGGAFAGWSRGVGAGHTARGPAGGGRGGRGVLARS